MRSGMISLWLVVSILGIILSWIVGRFHRRTEISDLKERLADERIRSDARYKKAQQYIVDLQTDRERGKI